jgi:hypothetical protein
VELLELLMWAREIVGPDRPVLPLVLLRLERRRPEDARALRQLGGIMAERARTGP